MPSPETSRRFVAAALGPLLLVAAFLGVRGARFDDDPLAALPADDTELAAFREAAEPFGLLRTLLIGVERDDLYSKDSLERLRSFTRRAAVVPGVREAVCFTEVPDVSATGARTEVADLVPRPVPDDPLVLARTRARVLAHPMVVGQLASADGRAALLPVVLDPARRPMRETAREVADLAHRELEGGRVVVDGAPGAAVAVANAQAGAGVLVGLVAAAALLLAPLLLFRRALPWLVALLGSAVVTAGSLLPAALLHEPLGPSALVALLGVFGVALLGSSYVVLAPDRRAAAARGTGPVVQALVSAPVVAVLTLLVSGGGFAVAILGCGAALVLALCAGVLPALAGAGATERSPRAAPPARPLLAVTLTVAFALPYLGVSRLQVAVEPDEAFPPGSGPRQAEQFLREHFDGSATMVAAVHGEIGTPEALDALRSLEAAALGDPATRSVVSLLGPVRMMGLSDGRAAELPPTANGVRRFFVMSAGQPGLGQLVGPDQRAASVLAKVDPFSPPDDLVRLRDTLLDSVPGALRYAAFAAAEPSRRERMEAELLDRLGRRLARLGISPEGRAPGLLGDLLARIERASGLDAEQIATRLGEHFVDGTTYLLVADLESNEPLAVGEAERVRLAEAVARAGQLDLEAVRAALVEVFPVAARDDEGLAEEARLAFGALERVELGGASKTELPMYVRGWAMAETPDSERAAAAEQELLRTASERKHGGAAMPDGKGVPLRVRVGGMPLAAASVRAKVLRDVTSGFLSAAAFGLVLWISLLLVGGGGAFGSTACSTGRPGLLSSFGASLPRVVVPLVAASLAVGGAGYLGLVVDPGLPVLFGVVLAVGGALGALLLAPHPGSRSWSDARRVALHLGPALAAVGLGLSLIPLPPARTLGLVLAVGLLAALVLGVVHSGRRDS
ncbi:MAG: hypothetical protein JXB32_00520 [Deltaproteobacteria bacterium]|nr:hypothetical protein [Deltaproteobacteria bacterium]